MSEKMPRVVSRLMETRPEVWEAYSKLGEATANAGPLDDKTRRLVKLALAIGCGSEGAVHSHARRASGDGCSAEELEQVALLAITTMGLPRAMAALTWIGDVIEQA